MQNKNMNVFYSSIKTRISCYLWSNSSSSQFTCSQVLTGSPQQFLWTSCVLVWGYHVSVGTRGQWRCLCRAGMQQASINLTQSLHEVYEPDWHGKDDVMTIGKVRVVETHSHLNTPHRHAALCETDVNVCPGVTQVFKCETDVQVWDECSCLKCFCVICCFTCYSYA